MLTKVRCKAVEHLNSFKFKFSVIVFSQLMMLVHNKSSIYLFQKIYLVDTVIQMDELPDIPYVCLKSNRGGSTSSIYLGKNGVTKKVCKPCFLAIIRPQG